MDGEQPLLQLPNEQHKLYVANTQPKLTLRVGPCQMGVYYQPRMKEGLMNLGLYQMKDVHDCYIDKGLITALVERWRPETNTFHLPVGECTVTLEDVSCLWGLPVTGLPISGCTDDNWSQLILDCLGHEVYDGYEDENDDFFHTRVDKRSVAGPQIIKSKYHMKLKWLKDNHSQGLTLGTPQQTVDRYTRAFCMNLFGAVMFPDANSSSVPIMYLQFLENLGPREQDYNWGGAVLACLYRELSRACRGQAISINGPLLLLQMWAWTRFSIGRPRPKNDLPFGDEVVEERLAFGAKWVMPHEWDGNPVRGVVQYRNQFERLNATAVNWMPYMSYYQHLPGRGLRDFPIFPCRVWCIHFWEVEIHCPDRVFRQFGLFQTVPPPSPPRFEYLEDLRQWVRASGLCEDGTSVDWSSHFADYIAAAPISFGETRPYDMDRYHEYMDWFSANGMPSLFPHQNNTAVLSQPVPEPEGDVGDLGYVSDAVIQARMRFRCLHNTAKGISMVMTAGQKAYGLQLLQISREMLHDIGHIALFTAMVEKAGLPSDISAIDISDDYPDRMPRDPEVQVPRTTVDDVMNGIYHSLEGITIDGRNLGDGASPSTSVPRRRKTKPPNKYSHSKYDKNPRGREE